MTTARAAIALSSLVLSATFAAHAAQSAPPPAAAQDAATTTGNDLVVGVDPRTGKLRQPTAAEVQALSTKAAAMKPRAAMARSAPVSPRTPAEARATMRTQAGHGTSMRVPESAMSQLTVMQDANGQLHFSEDGVPQQAPAKQEVSR